VPSAYSANENAGDATQIRGTKNPAQAGAKGRSLAAFYGCGDIDNSTPFPCGARMAIITTVLVSTSAFAIHGFIFGTVPFTPYSDCRQSASVECSL
jgi:hypothetical protein